MTANKAEKPTPAFFEPSMITKPALEALKDRLMTESVAEEIDERLCESVTAK